MTFKSMDCFRLLKGKPHRIWDLAGIPLAGIKASTGKNILTNVFVVYRNPRLYVCQ